MAQTISDLEKERAELLKAIEAQAQQMSANRNGEEKEHSLKDWLNAAEEVMPTPQKTKTTSSAPQSGDKNNKPNANKTSFFGVVILLTLLFTILGVLYIAYTTINKELQQVAEVRESSKQEMLKLQQSMDELQKNLASGGQPEAFTQLEQRVLDLEGQLSAIQEQQKRLLARLEQSPIQASGQVAAESAVKAAENMPATEVHSASVASSADQVVTESILDEKLKAYTSQLEKRIDEKLEKILQYLTHGKADEALKSEVLLNGDSDGETVKGMQQPEAEVATPAEPEVVEVEAPRVEQPLVKLVEEVKKPIEPEVTVEPHVALSADAKWLLDQPAQHYILQLASMADQQALMNMVKRKGLADTKIVMQKRGDDQRYVLLTGSYASRKEADQKAKQIKDEFGISPWIRKAKDLTPKLP
ncbi:SPOR domain-containing protein [Thiomicrorhabdus sp. zzn3]|uniref:SPOR domain-containing protein n=1 Tax=Thiomicrorhabdus sp. zzn3 TaxID=3039775 RepID=UPI0024367EF1|nr:SPOR domain-containing protein [Thiomicrorhabdus sp. zzn3]MDG6778055.1 SPOR domain-containing protein [Thiomicrorhabdus sp. zzn3]